MKHGLVALGDSIMNGHGEPMLGVQCQSWALWLAQAAGWCFTKHSVGGASSTSIVGHQVPRVQRMTYEVAAFNMGANNVLYDWEEDRFGRDLTTVAAALDGVADQVMVVNLPSTFASVPAAPPSRAHRVGRVNAWIDDLVASTDVLLLEVRDLHGPRFVRPDRVHPTAVGQLMMAERAATLLQATGLQMPLRPWAMPRGTPDARLGLAFRGTHAVRTGSEIARTAAKRVLRHWM